MSGHSDQVLELHKKIIELGDGMAAADVMAALGLSVAFACRHCMDANSTIVQGLKAFNQLVVLEYYDPNSQMVVLKDMQ